MKKKITVHVLLDTSSCANDHIEIMLSVERERAPWKKYYLINQATSPWHNATTKNIWINNTSMSIENYMAGFDDQLTFTIEEELGEIIKQWKARREATTGGRIKSLRYDCADAVLWFMHQFADMPKPRFYHKPISCDQALLCCFLPSFFQPISLPSRVMRKVKQFLEGQSLLADTSEESSPDKIAISPT